MAERRRGQDRGCCLIFHRAVASADWAGLPNRGFHLDLGYLERLIGYVRARGWDIVTMDEALRRIARPGQRRFVNFSLDDGYRDTAEQVVPLFQRLGAPITVFVATGLPDGTMRMRDAGLETILATAERVTDAGQTYVLDTPQHRRDAYRAISTRWSRAEGDAEYVQFCTRHGEDADRLDILHRITWPMLRGMCKRPGVEIGAHTVSHPHVAALDDAAAFAELQGSRSRLQEMLGVDARHFAFPFGQPSDCGERDFAFARQAGFASAATTVKGLVRPGANPFSIGRNTINGTHRHLAFAEAHLSGLSGLTASLRQTVLRRG